MSPAVVIALVISALFLSGLVGWLSVPSFERDRKRELEQSRHRIQTLKCELGKLKNRCGDLLADHRCDLEIGHVGAHQDDSAAWFGMAEFPHPEVTQAQEDWRKYNETSMRWHRELADWIGAEK